MKKVCQAALSEEEQAQLQALISKGKTSARQLTRARFMAGARGREGPRDCARALQTSVSTVERTRKNLLVLARYARPRSKKLPRPGAKPKLDAQPGRAPQCVDRLADPHHPTRIAAAGCWRAAARKSVRG